MFFILGSPRSGTTLLAQCLNAHSKIVIPDETDFIIPCAFVYDSIDDPTKRKSLVSDIIINSTRFQSSIGEYLTPGEVYRIVETCGARMDGLLSGLYQAIAEKDKCLVGGDKRPYNINFLRILTKVGAISADTTIIHIVRDIRDVMSSLTQYEWSSDLDLYFPRLWSCANLYLSSMYGRRERYLLIKYEEFVSAPEQTISAVTAHLGLTFEPNQMLPERRHSRYRGQRHHARLYEPISAHAIGRFRESFGPGAIAEIERQAAEAMVEYRYDLTSPFGQGYQTVIADR
jgi:Sulfotransferase family